ncbi:MAG: type IV pilus biogenesis/stability protein PilW [Sideroxydans sp.]|nr:type IV pilus biogenesis/stability protein PilW [Sideroxydans sp.]
MKWFAMILAVWGLAGCASQPASGSLDDNRTQVMTRAEAIAKVHTELAAAYYGRGQYAVALEEVATALKFEDGYAPAYNVRGLVHMQLLEDKEAEADFLHSLRLDPGSSDTQNNYGWFLCQRGRERESVPHFLEAVKNPLYSTPERAYVNAGVCSEKAGEMKNAELYLRRALILQPNMPEALVGLADVSFVNGNYELAKSYFTRFEQWTGTPLTAANLWLAVRIERKLGDDNAEASYALQLRKNFPDAHETQLMLQVQ